MSSASKRCRPEALELFQAQLGNLEETDSLVRAATAVAIHKHHDVAIEAVEKSLDKLAARIIEQVRCATQEALVARLHEVLFEEYGLRGNIEDYYNPENSLLPSVLATRRGIPVTLALIYKSVAQRVGLAARGINAPLHFLASVEVNGSWMIIDAFNHGRMLTRDEAFDYLEKKAGKPVVRSPALLRTVTHPEWLARILHNLIAVYAAAEQHEDREAMEELLALVPI